MDDGNSEAEDVHVNVPGYWPIDHPTTYAPSPSASVQNPPEPEKWIQVCKLFVGRTNSLIFFIPTGDGTRNRSVKRTENSGDLPRMFINTHAHTWTHTSHGLDYWNFCQLRLLLVEFSIHLDGQFGTSGWIATRKIVFRTPCVDALSRLSFMPRTKATKWTTNQKC